MEADDILKIIHTMGEDHSSAAVSLATGTISQTVRHQTQGRHFAYSWSLSRASLILVSDILCPKPRGPAHPSSTPAARSSSHDSQRLPMTLPQEKHRTGMICVAQYGHFHP